MTPGRQRTLLWVGFTLAAYGRQQGAALEYVSPICPAMPPAQRRRGAGVAPSYVRARGSRPGVDRRAKMAKRK